MVLMVDFMVFHYLEPMKKKNQGIYCPNIKSYLEMNRIEHTQKNEDFHIISFTEFNNKEIFNQKFPIKIRSRKLGFFQIVISNNHDANLTIDGTKYHDMKVDIVFIAPNQIVSFDVKSLEQSTIAYSLVFSSEFLNGTQSNYNLLKNFPFFNMNHPPVYQLTTRQNNFFIEHMNKIYTYFKILDKDNLEIIRSYLTIMLYEAKRMFIIGEVKSVANSRAEEITYQFETLITETKNKKQKLEYFAKKLSFSSIYLAECVKKTTGKTAKKIITEYIILESKSLLNQSTMTINDIAFQLGFNDTSNFIAMFKKNVGITPSQFRKV